MFESSNARGTGAQLLFSASAAEYLNERAFSRTAASTQRDASAAAASQV
jgi:hypothetical protein